MYEQQILRILLGVGARGISVNNLAKHVYNLSCTLFDSPDFDSVYQSVRQYVYRQAHSRRALIEPTGKRGCYRLSNNGAMQTQQLLLDFDNEVPEEMENEKPQQDFSLNLFDDSEF